MISALPARTSYVVSDASLVALCRLLIGSIQCCRLHQQHQTSAGYLESPHASYAGELCHGSQCCRTGRSSRRYSMSIITEVGCSRSNNIIIFSGPVSLVLNAVVVWTRRHVNLFVRSILNTRKRQMLWSIRVSTIHPMISPLFVNRSWNTWKCLPRYPSFLRRNTSGCEWCSLLLV